MKAFTFISLKFVLFSISLLAFTASSHDFNAGKLEIGHPWARPTAPVVKTGAVYLSIHNSSHSSERLISASVQPAVAEQVKIHETSYAHDMAKMHEAKKGIAISAESTLELRPGGSHIMLVGLKKPLVLGAKFPMKLKFEHNPEISVEVWVEEYSVKDPVSSKHSHH